MASAAPAAVFTVTSGADMGPGSLRQAIADAATSTDADNTIRFLLPAGSTINLGTPLPPFSGASPTSTLTFDGSLSPGLTLDTGGNSSPAFLDLQASLTLLDVDITGGGRLMIPTGLLSLTENATGIFGTDVSEVFLSVIKLGPGTTVIAAGQQIGVSTGSVQILQGALQVDGTLSGSAGVRVAPSASLTGTGLVVGPTRVEGVLAPTGSTGSMTLVNGLTFASGSTFAPDVLDSNMGDSITTDTLTIEPGAVLAPQVQPSSLTGMTMRQIVQATTSITGSFSVRDYAFLTEEIDQDATSITVMLTPNGESLGTLAGSDNQRRVAATLMGLEGTATGDLDAVLDAIDRSTTAEVGPLLDGISGEALTAFATGRQILGERTARALHRRVRDRTWGESQAVYASRIDAAEFGAPIAGFADPGLAPLGRFGATARRADGNRPAGSVAAPKRHGPDRGGVWLDAFGLFGTLEGERGEAEVETTLFGGMLGFDAWLSDALVLGVAAGYARGDIDPQGRRVDLDADTIHGALYGGWSDPRGFVSAYGRYAYTFQESTRVIRSSVIERTATAEWEAQDFGAGAEAGITLYSGEYLAIQPLAGIDWLRLTEDRYRESGAGALGLDVDPEDLDSVTSRLGARVLGHFVLDPRVAFAPEVRVFWQREFGDRERILRARLIDTGPLGSLPVRGPELPRDALIAGVGWSASLGDRLQVLFDYDALLDSDRVEHQGNLAVRLRF